MVGEAYDNVVFMISLISCAAKAGTAINSITAINIILFIAHLLF
jgi:hypothetical protein